MRRIEFTFKILKLKGYEQTDVKWQGYESETPGLVVCRAPCWRYAVGDNDSGQWAEGRGWQVIHLTSGRNIENRYLPTRKAALHVARLLATVGRWDRSREDIIAMPGVTRHAIRAECVKVYQAVEAQIGMKEVLA